MENTNCGSECPFVKTGFCNSDRECPNFVESCWIEGKTGEQKMIKDCVPKRLMIQNNTQHIRLEGLQKAIEQQRNAFIAICETFSAVLSKIENLKEKKSDLIENEKTLQIE